MQKNGTKGRMLSIAAVALLALAVVPVLASTASAATVAPAASPTSTEWAYGGQGWSAGGITAGRASLTWNASAGAVVIYNATSTGPNTTELSAIRTVAVTISASFSAPYTSWAYHLKAVEIDRAYANLTNASTVTLANTSVVPALGLLNASLHANASLQASLVGKVANLTASDYLNVSGWARAAVDFSPSLGLFPLNLSGVTSWTSAATATGNAAWNLTWNFADHGWNGTSASKSGNVSGTWTTTTAVALFGHVGGTYAKWIDHRLRTAIALGLSGPFDLYAGVLLVPHAFDLFGGGVTAYAGSGMGATAVTSEYLFVSSQGRHLNAQSVSAGNFSAGTANPSTITLPSTGMQPAVSPAAGSSGATVWEQPESPAAAQSQASCLEFGCGSGAKPLSLALPILIVGVVAVVAIALILSRRSKGGQAADTPLSAQPAGGPTMPTRVDPSGPARPPQ